MRIIKKYIKEILKEDISKVDSISAVGQYAHRGQKRRTGKPYFSHPAAVADLVKDFYPGNIVAQHSAILHDALEDAIESGNVTDEEELVAMIHDAIDDESLASRVIDVVFLLTKPPGADYTEYILSLSKDEDALIVKLADMLDNISDNPSARQKTKYLAAFQALEKKFQGKPSSIHASHWNKLRIILNE